MNYTRQMTQRSVEVRIPKKLSAFLFAAILLLSIVPISTEGSGNYDTSNVVHRVISVVGLRAFHVWDKGNEVAI